LHLCYIIQENNYIIHIYTISDAVKIKDVKKNIKSLELIVKRNNLRGLSNVDLYEKEIARLKDWCEKTVAALPPKVDNEKSK
jgi:hypothetical protein